MFFAAYTTPPPPPPQPSSSSSSPFFNLIQFNLYLPYIQNSTMQGWNNEIKEKVNGEET